jgi:glucose-6-phosphate 1-dehydrogenase
LFGATGDLAKRMIWPSLFNLHADGLLAPDLKLLGLARSEHTLAEAREMVAAALKEFLPADRNSDPAVLSAFLDRISYSHLDVTAPQGFDDLCTLLGDRSEGALYYLATSPTLYGPICAGLRAAGLADQARGVVLEKPIGTDLATSRTINAAVGQAFDEDRVFRVDHYLGKETVQNLLALRFANILFEPIWNSAHIEHVQITVAETVGVEGRWSYYDGSGALRDMVQNHLLQLLCLVAMEPPAAFDPQAVRNEKIKVLRSLRPIRGADVGKMVVAGQYGPGASAQGAVPGYGQEAGGRSSGTETFVALRADLDNWRWAGTPFFLRTGKRMPERRSEIIVQFRGVPHDIFGGAAVAGKNVLRIRLQPEETVELTVLSKEPGLEGMRLQPVQLNLSLSEAFHTHRRRIAYERLIRDALLGLPTLFVRRDEVEAAWEWIDGISAGWALPGHTPKPYAAGTWGPVSAVALIERAGFSWAD